MRNQTSTAPFDEKRSRKEYRTVTYYAQTLRDDAIGAAQSLAKSILEKNPPATVVSKLKFDTNGKLRCVLYQVSEEEKPSADAACEIVQTVLGRGWIVSCYSDEDVLATYYGTPPKDSSSAKAVLAGATFAILFGTSLLSEALKKVFS